MHKATYLAAVADGDTAGQQRWHSAWTAAWAKFEADWQELEFPDSDLQVMAEQGLKPHD